MLAVAASATFAGLAAPGMAAGPLSVAAAHLHLLGFVHWPTALIAAACGMAAAPFGVRLSGRLPARRLKRACSEGKASSRPHKQTD